MDLVALKTLWPDISAHVTLRMKVNGTISIQVLCGPMGDAATCSWVRSINVSPNPMFTNLNPNLDDLSSVFPLCSLAGAGQGAHIGLTTQPHLRPVLQHLHDLQMNQL